MRWSLLFSASAVFLVGSAQNTPSNLQKYKIAARGINVSFIGYGARLTNLLVNDKNSMPQDIVLGYDDASRYINDTQHEHTYFGAVVGRYANRMKNGTFTVDGLTSHITQNDHTGHDTLHGGTIGYDQRNWTLISHNATTITFMLFDQGFEGFPGNVLNYATFSVADGPSFTSRLVSIPLDEPTPIMLTTHPYWNLDAFTDASNPTVLNHTLHMPYSTRFIGIDSILVANGTIAPVHKTTLDFTSPKTFGRDLESATDTCGFNCTGYDTSFILDRPRFSEPEATDISVLSMSSNVTGIRMDLYTNQQTLLIYTCNQLTGTIPVKRSQLMARKLFTRSSTAASPSKRSSGSTASITPNGARIGTRSIPSTASRPLFGPNMTLVFCLDSEVVLPVG